MSSADWTPYAPDARLPWDRRRAAHLLRRAGFGGTADDLELTRARGLDDTLRWLLDASPQDADPLDEGIRRLAQHLGALDRAANLQAEWAYRLVHTPRPLEEKMTLFWHGHFATSLAKVKKPQLMAAQLATLRRHAVGNFRSLLLAVARDPAMCVWLDSNTNVAGRPNENFARELFELFTMGRGTYTERDVAEAARAFTGWHVAGDRFVLRKRLHDHGVKEVFGRRGRFDGEEVVDMALAQPATARFLARKLFAFFVHPDPAVELVEPLAERLRKDYEIRPVVEMILRSRIFFSKRAYRVKIKSPAELVVGAVQATGAQVPARSLATAMAAMGQNLLYPPNVKGWDGERSWINASSLIARAAFFKELTGADGRSPGRWFDPLTPVPRTRRSASGVVDHYLDLLLQGEAPVEVDAGLRGQARRSGGDLVALARGLVQTIMNLPEYQLS